MTNVAPRANGSFRRQSFGNLGQKSKNSLSVWSPPPADENVDTSPAHEESLTLDLSDDKRDGKDVSRIESNNDERCKTSGC